MYRKFFTNVCALLSVVVISQTVEANSRLLEIEEGQISGVRVANDVDAFLGIPYAAPPVGPLRWKAPRPVQHWDGVFKANKYPTACPQIGNFFANVPASQFGKPVGTEDCLYLNVWRPTTAKVSRLPVVVWIHGGSNFKGTSADPMYDGKFLASKSNVVMVSLNYRIGLLGAISYKALETSGTKLDKSGNFVTLDLIQGLKWVRDNIKTFGGDPNNVTIMGQSAGCMNVWGLLQTPLSEGLFHKAVCSSGVPNIYPKIIGRSRSSDFVENLVFNAGLVTDRKKAGEFIHAKGDKWTRDFLYSRTSDELVMGQDYSVPVQHIEDDAVFPHGLEATALGFYHQVPMILGSTMDEGTYLLGAQFFKPDLTTLWGYLQNTPADLKFEDVINTCYATFRTATKSASLVLNRTISNIYLTARLYNSETYRYNFEWNETPQPWKDIFGSVHGMDAIFYLGNFDSERENFARFAWTEENRTSREALREKMNKHFTQFFWTGYPGWKGTIDFK
jgi:para-nitrobenzyl esterase